MDRIADLVYGTDLSPPPVAIDERRSNAGPYLARPAPAVEVAAATSPRQRGTSDLVPQKEWANAAPTA